MISCMRCEWTSDYLPIPSISEVCQENDGSETAREEQRKEDEDIVNTEPPLDHYTGV